MSKHLEHIKSWAKSIQGNEIPLWRFRSADLSAPILFIGGVHGDEPEGVWLAEDFLLWLKNDATEDDWRQFKNFDLIPCLNIDGFKKRERTNANGVDLNRNFPSEDWSTEHKALRYYPGKNPNSEPETQALVRLIDEIAPRVIIHFHSWKPCVVYTGEPGKVWADTLAQSAQYESHPDIGYPTPGSLGQYGWLNCNTPVVCIEEAEGANRKEIWAKFKQGMLNVLKMERQK